MAAHTCLLSTDYKCLNLTSKLQKASLNMKDFINANATSPRPAHNGELSDFKDLWGPLETVH